MRSMAHWPVNAILVCRGIMVESFADMLVQEARALSVAERIELRPVKAFQADALSLRALMWG